jgi:hypothetical protein
VSDDIDPDLVHEGVDRDLLWASITGEQSREKASMAEGRPRWWT